MHKFSVAQLPLDQQEMGLGNYIMLSELHYITILITTVLLVWSQIVYHKNMWPYNYKPLFSVPVSHDSVSLSQHTQHPETEAANWNPAAPALCHHHVVSSAYWVYIAYFISFYSISINKVHRWRKKNVSWK